jgi:hypothetical protein
MPLSLLNDDFSTVVGPPDFKRGRTSWRATEPFAGQSWDSVALAESVD